MIVSWNWLTDYVRLDMPVDALTARLALTGLNHESTEDVGGDLAIDLEVTSNRPDCLGHLGVAREISVLYGRPLRQPDPQPVALGPDVHHRTSVDIQAPVHLCPQFTARVITGIRVGESPWWLRKRLETLGIRPVSNIVDITNYVMFECGQPLHAYDLEQLVNRRLVVREAQKGETLRAINQKDYALAPGMLVIADALRPVGLAGVMGGLETEIGPGTVNVLIESARFDALNVRKTARALSLFSPSSYRFERPLDPSRTEWASRRCAQLILELAGGTLDAGVIDVGPKPPQRAPITLRLNQIERVLGIPIDRTEAERILQLLGLERLASDDATLTVRPPSWRADLEREIDLIEEIARIHGYEHIPEDRAVPLVSSTRSPRERVEAAVRSAITGMGFDEACTFSLVGPSLAEPVVPSSQTVESAPLHVEHSSRRRENLLRQSVTPSLLAARAFNASRGADDARLFEMADVYLPSPGQPLPHEPARLALVAGLDYFAMKAVVEVLIDRLHVGDTSDIQATPLTGPGLLTSGRSAQISIGDDILGWVGEVSAEALSRFDLKTACAAAELDLNILINRSCLVPRHRPQSETPAMSRDLSLIVPITLPWADLSAVARDAAGPHLESIDWLDTFAGPGVPDGHHSLHFGLRFRHPARTLTSDEVDRAVKQIVDACASRLSAVLRS
jgi:phenylalanyl-tRNA synthetase beta chain